MFPFAGNSPPAPTVYVTDVAALGTIGTGMPVGTVAQTTARGGSLWYLAATTQNGTLLVASNRAGYSWIRDVVTGAPGASAKDTWYVDPTTGSDDNDGLTSGTALLTPDEFFYRLGRQPIDGITITVNILGDIAYSGGSLALAAFARFDNSGALWIVGQRNVTATDTIAAVTAWNAGAGTIGNYTLTTATTASLVGKYVRISSGGSVGTKTPVVKSTGAKSFRGIWTDVSGNPAEPTVGDTVEIYTPTVINGNVSIETEGRSANSLGVLFQDIEIGVPAQSHSVIIRSGEASFTSCVVHGLDAWRGCSLATIAGCYVVEHRAYGQVQTWGSVFTAGAGASFDARGGGLITTYGPTLIQGGSIVVGHTLEGVGTIVVSDAGNGGGPLVVADYPAGQAAVTVYPNSQIIARDTMFIRDAAGSGQTGYAVQSGGAIYYVGGFVPATYGTAPGTTFAKIGGTNKASAAIPYFETTNGAAIVVAQ